MSKRLKITMASASNTDFDESLIILEAIRCGNCYKIKEMLHNGLDANRILLNFNETMLTIACKLGQSDIVRVLLESGSDANKTVDDSLSPLQHACLKNDAATIEILLQNKANPNRGKGIYSPLYLGVSRQNFSAVQCLLRHGALPNTCNSTSRTLVHIAAKKDDVKIVKSLIDFGADVHATDDFNETPLVGAVRANRIENVQYLLEHGSSVDICSNDGDSLLHVTAKSDSVVTELAYLLMDFGCSVNKLNRQNETPLSLSVARANSLELNKCLVKHGAEINNSPMYRALRKGLMVFGFISNVQTMQFCIEAGLNVADLPWINDYLQYKRPRRFNFWNSNAAGNDDEVEEHEILQSYIKKLLRNPLPLFKICRRAVRDHAISVSNGKSMYFKLLTLPLPEILQNSLVLEDL